MQHHGIRSHYFMANRWGNSGNSDRLYFLGFQIHCGWWLQPWNWKILAPWKKICDKWKWKSLSRVPMDYTVQGILPARILKWVAAPFSRGSSQSKDRTQVSHIVGEFFMSWATGETHVETQTPGLFACFWLRDVWYIPSYLLFKSSWLGHIILPWFSSK